MGSFPRPRGRILAVTTAALFAAALTFGASPALADHGPGGGGGGGGGGTDIPLETTGSCGDNLRLRVRNTGVVIELDITIPSIDPTEVWNLSATEQLYGADTGARHGNPINLVPSPLPQPVYDAVEGGFVSSADIANTDNATTGISYTATRSSPSPITCTNQAFWTNPFGSGFGPASQNPTGRPDSPPLFNTLSEADAGANDVLLQFDQEMLDSGLGVPANNRFAVTVNGAARAVTAVAIINDSPPDLALLDLTFDGAALTSGRSVTVRYTRPLTSGQATLRDLEGNQTPSFGPVTVPVL
jgi:Putative flagellar system-associated repeat